MCSAQTRPNKLKNHPLTKDGRLTKKLSPGSHHPKDSNVTTSISHVTSTKIAGLP